MQSFANFNASPQSQVLKENNYIKKASNGTLTGQLRPYVNNNNTCFSLVTMMTEI